jgi:hypothetical protein
MREFSMWALGILSSSGASVLLGGFIVWLARAWIVARLTASLRVQTEKELTAFGKRLDATEQQVNSVRDAGLEAARFANAAVLRERVRATREFAHALIEWNSLVALSMLIGAMNSEWAKKNAREPGTSSFADSILKSSKAEDLLTRMQALGAYRPFVTEKSWALFSALQSFYAIRVAKCMALRIGNPEMAERLWAADAERKLVAAIIPDQIEAYDRNPVETESPFTDAVRDQLLAELRRGLSGEHSGSEAVHDAATILGATDEVTREVERLRQTSLPDVPKVAPGPETF